MLTKKDLAKEFSLVVQQEIKNHNESVLITNIAIEELRRNLADLESKLSKQLTKLFNNLQERESEFNWINESVKDLFSNLLRKINDQGKDQLDQMIALKRSVDARESYFLTIENFNEFESKFDQGLSHLKLNFSLQKDVLAAKVLESEKKLATYIDSCISELSKKIDQEIEERKKINVTLDHFALSFAGHNREIELCKKRSFIIEKNVENLYTQIERLKEGAS